MAQVKIGSNFQKVWDKEKNSRQNKGNRYNQDNIKIKIGRIPDLDLVGGDS
jgi:hypothetical protein